MNKPSLRKTTIVLDEALYRRAKARAAEEGRSLGSVVAESISLYLVKPQVKAEEFTLPVAEGASWPEGLTWEKIEDIMEQEDLEFYLDRRQHPG